MKKILLLSFIATLLSGMVFGQTAVVPIVELKNRGLLGGVRNGRWIPPSRVAPGLKDETEFVLVGWNGLEEGAVTLGKKGEAEDVCRDFTRMEFELTQDHGVAIGTTAKWNPVPRMPRAIHPGNATYKSVVTKFLAERGVSRPVVQIKEAFRIDLEGDGVEEVVLSATHYKKGLSSSAAPGDYSLVIVRKNVGSVVTDHLLQGDFVMKRVDFGAPSEHHISTIADLNGDGKMEIVLYGFYYEGGFASAWEMKDGRPVEIKEFKIGCGV
jgi:hypothetical protein